MKTIAKPVSQSHHLHVGRRREIGEFGAAWLQGHGLSVGSEVMGCSSRLRRAASSLQDQQQEPVVASHGPAKTPL